MARTIYNFTDDEDDRIYIYYRNGVKLYTPCLPIADKRRDEGTEIEILG